MFTVVTVVTCGTNKTSQIRKSLSLKVTQRTKLSQVNKVAHEIIED